MSNQICLLWLKLQFFFILGRIRINTICLPFNSDPNETWETYDTVTAGWGYTETALPDGQFRKYCSYMPFIYIWEHFFC